jgi:hypothetical protein
MYFISCDFNVMGDFYKVVTVLREDSYRNNGPLTSLPAAKQQAKIICTSLGMDDYSHLLNDWAKEDIYALIIE